MPANSQTPAGSQSLAGSTTQIIISNNSFPLTLDQPLATIKEEQGQALTATQALKSIDYSHRYYSESLLAGSGTYWQKLSFSNTNDQPIQLYLIFENPIITHLDIFQFKQNTLIKSAQLGAAELALRSNEVSLYSNKLAQVFDLTLAANESTRLLLRKNSHSPAILPMLLFDKESFSDYKQRQLLFWGGAIAILLIIAIYNSAIYLLVRNSAYLWYLAFYSVSFFYFAGLHGFGLLLWPHWLQTWLAEHMMSFNFLLLVIVMNFAVNFLMAKKYAPTFYRLLPYWNATFTLGFICTFIFAEYHIIPFFGLLQALGSAFVITMGVKALKAGFYPARFFLISWAFVLTGAAIGFMTYLSLVPANFFTIHAFFLSTVCELLLLSIALADRIRYSENLAMAQAYIDPRTFLPNYSYFKSPDYQLATAQPAHEYKMLLLQLEGLRNILGLFGPLKLDKVRLAHIQHVIQYLQTSDWAVPFTMPDKKFHFLISLPTNQLLIVARSDQDLTANINELLRLAETPVKVQHLNTKLNFRIGVAKYSPAINNQQESYRQAQMALLACEDSQKNWQFYEPAMDQKTGDQLELLADLRVAIKTDQLEIYIQPQFSIKNQELLGGEVLVRWQHPHKGMIPPGLFVPLAEQSNLIDKITQLVIQKSFDWLNNSPQLPSDFHLSINLSALDLQQKELIPFIRQQLEHYQLDASCIAFELTESAVMQDQQLFLQVIAEIHQLGFTIAIDDFGTGYSSLRYLQQINADIIKIDMSFVRDIHHSLINQKIVDAIIKMAASTGAYTVAEGVESQQELDILQDLGARLVQGFMTGKPVPADKFISTFLSFKPLKSAQTND